MRRTGIAALAFVALAASAGAAGAQTVLGVGIEPAALQQRIVAAIAGHAGTGEVFVIRGLKPSLARNGRGYCGEVANSEAGPFSPFQIILDEDCAASVLVQSDADRPESRVPSEVVNMLLKNAGCLE